MLCSQSFCTERPATDLGTDLRNTIGGRDECNIGIGSEISNYRNSPELNQTVGDIQVGKHHISSPRISNLARMMGCVSPLEVRSAASQRCRQRLSGGRNTHACVQAAEVGPLQAGCRCHSCVCRVVTELRLQIRPDQEVSLCCCHLHLSSTSFSLHMMLLS